MFAASSILSTAQYSSVWCASVISPGPRITVGAPSTQWWISLSTAIVFGLAFATVLTLVVTPAALMAIEQLAARRRRWGAALRSRFARA